MKKIVLLIPLLLILSIVSYAQKTLTTPSGLKITITKEGKGDKPKKGAKVYVNYIGTLASNGVEFDNSEGYPIDFILGTGQVIKGWDESIAMLRKGSKATLYVPAKLGYGEKGYPMSEGEGVSIPPNTDLIFEVELKKFKPSK